MSPVLDSDTEELYDEAPCGFLSTTPDGRIVRINATLLRWLGLARDDVVGRKRFPDLLTMGGRIYHETHISPLLSMQGEVGGLALDLVVANGDRMPVLATCVVKKDVGGEPLLVRITLFDARDRRAYERELLRARKEAERLATTLQRTLLPPVLPEVPGLRAAAYYHHASPDEVGGDFYDLFPLGDGRWGVFLGDVCGKGARAAAVTSLTRYTLRSAAAFDPDPLAVLANLNTVLRFEADSPQFCTVIFGVISPDFVITLAGGGHTPPLLLRADGSAEPVEVGGQLVGVLAHPRFASVEVRLGVGDTLLLYTDGVTEARVGDDRQRFGDDALLRFAGELAPSSAPAAVSAVETLLARFGDGLDDDTAVLALSR